MLGDASVFDIEKQIIKMLSVAFSSDCKKIELGLRLVEDLYVDSLGFVEVVMALNEMLGIELSGEMVGEWKTVQDIVVGCSVCSGKTLRM